MISLFGSIGMDLGYTDFFGGIAKFLRGTSLIKPMSSPIQVIFMKLGRLLKAIKIVDVQ